MSSKFDVDVVEIENCGTDKTLTADPAVNVKSVPQFCRKQMNKNRLHGLPVEY